MPSVNILAALKTPYVKGMTKTEERNNGVKIISLFHSIKRSMKVNDWLSKRPLSLIFS